MQTYISRAQRHTAQRATCTAFESKKKGIMIFHWLGMWRYANKEEFLKRWRPTICQERPTA